MNKSSSAVALILSFGFLVGSFSAFMPVMAQQTTTVPGPTGFPPLTTATNTTNATATQQPTAPAVTTTTTNATGTGTLSARGLISSFILSTGQPTPPTPTNATGGGNATNATTPAPAPAESLLPYILGGDWNMNVNNGNVTSFDSNFTMVHTDGTEKHTHDITNFVSNPDSAPLQPNTNETALVIGNSNIGVDGSPKWNNVETTLILDKLSTLSIIVDSNATDNHFKNQPIYGIVTSPASQANTTAPAG
jgi:hypothetical protein